MSNFKIGDRVKIITPGPRKNLLGTVCDIDRYDKNVVGVSHDIRIVGHDCDGMCRNGYGWNYMNNELELMIPTIDNWEEELK